MLSLTMAATAVKPFMGRLLKESIFDAFAVRSIDLILATRISISGLLEDGGEAKAYALWGDMRPLVHDVIKGGQKPKYIKIVLSHPSPTEIHGNAAALFINLTYEKDGVFFTTAAAQRQFALDKSLDGVWDDWARAFFVQAGIEVIDNMEAI